MLYEETACTLQETPGCGPPRRESSLYRPSALGGGAVALLIIGLVVWGLIDTRTRGHLTAEAHQEAWKFLQPWITQCGDFHYITFPGGKTQSAGPAAYHIVQIRGFELQVASAPQHTVDLEWTGVVTSRAKAARMFFSETGTWTPWSDWRQLGGATVAVFLRKWDAQGGNSPMWEVYKYDTSSLDRAHAALSCKTIAHHLTGGGSRRYGTQNAQVHNLLDVHTWQGLEKERAVTLSSIATQSIPAYIDHNFPTLGEFAGQAADADVKAQA